MEAGRVSRNAKICETHPRFTNTGGLLINSWTFRSWWYPLSRSIGVITWYPNAPSRVLGPTNISWSCRNCPRIRTHLWSSSSTVWSLNQPLLTRKTHPISFGRIMGGCRKFLVYRSINSFFHCNLYTCHVPRAKLVTGIATDLVRLWEEIGRVRRIIPIMPNFRRPVLFMYERLRPPGFQAGSGCSVGPPPGEEGGCGVDIYLSVAREKETLQLSW